MWLSKETARELAGLIRSEEALKQMEPWAAEKLLEFASNLETQSPGCVLIITDAEVEIKRSFEPSERFRIGYVHRNDCKGEKFSPECVGCRDAAHEEAIRRIDEEKP